MSQQLGLRMDMYMKHSIEYGGGGGGGVVLPAEFLSVLSLTFCSVIGTPPQSDWPANVSLPRSSFPRYPPFSLAELIPEMCESGILLLKVRLSEKCSTEISCR